MESKIRPETWLKRRGEWGRLFLDNQPKYMAPHKTSVSYLPDDITWQMQKFEVEYEIGGEGKCNFINRNAFDRWEKTECRNLHIRK